MKFHFFISSGSFWSRLLPSPRSTLFRSTFFFFFSLFNSFYNSTRKISRAQELVLIHSSSSFFYDEGEREAWRSVRNSQKKKWFHIISGCCEWAEWMNWWSLNFGFGPSRERKKSVWKIFSNKREGRDLMGKSSFIVWKTLNRLSCCPFHFELSSFAVRAQLNATHISETNFHSTCASQKKRDFTVPLAGA